MQHKAFLRILLSTCYNKDYRMEQKVVRDLMTIRLDYPFLKRIGEEDQHIRYIIDHSRNNRIATMIVSELVFV